jgi:predicted aspartyl protease
VKSEVHRDFKITETNHLIISCKINGVEGNFIIDSGASNSCVDTNLTSKFKLKTSLSQENASSATSTISKMYISKNNRLQIEGLLHEDFNVFLFDMSHINKTFINNAIEEIDGIIGGDILKKFKAKIDYDKKKIYLKF